MATYRLKNFDSYLATTGFRCVMLTGSYADGDSINEEDGHILADGFINIDDKSKIVIEGKDGVSYRFDNNGRCLTADHTNYKLMMAGIPQEASDSGALEEIKNALDTLNGTIEAYLQQTENRIKALEDKAEDFKQRIEDLENK